MFRAGRKVKSLFKFLILILLLPSCTLTLKRINARLCLFYVWLVFFTSTTLKGGLALEVRIARARTTRDIDLRITGAAGALLAKLQRAGRLDLADSLAFEVLPDPVHPRIEAEGPRGSTPHTNKSPIRLVCVTTHVLLRSSNA